MALQRELPKRLCYDSARGFHTTPTLFKKTGTEPRKENRWSMYPDLHSQLMQLLQKNKLSFAFHDIDNPIPADGHEWDTHIMGRFPCLNTKCTSTGWSSKKIAITIRLYPNKKYNARVYHQHCLSCNELSRPSLDEDSYVERLAYWLKKWSGIAVQRPHHGSGHSDRPHHSDLCEGCKAGHCREADDFED